ncbi:MAG: hypothetical protein EA422_02865 [Gemmatimonadales bacterium]|nr:MAG: hypothetical protein EA422_02865 [Gemmatimonadales bacterium]
MDIITRLNGRSPGPVPAVSEAPPEGPDAWGADVARSVWESFSDALDEPSFHSLLARLGVPSVEGVPESRVAEEYLIFLLWTHTRAVQLAFAGRGASGLMRQTLDALHRAVYSDLQEQGTPVAEIPLLEQRLAARYVEYGTAARRSDREVGRLAASCLGDTWEIHSEEAIQELTARAVALATPIKDYLQDLLDSIPRTDHDG